MRKPVNPIWKEIQGKYKISDTYFRKFRAKAGDNVEEVIRLCEEKEARDKKREERKIAPPEKKQSKVRITDPFPKSGNYEIAVPDHIMGYDEYSIWLLAHLTKSVYIYRGKFHTIRQQHHIDSEDLAHDVWHKCLRPNKQGKNAYDRYLAEPVKTVQTIRSFCNTVVKNHFADFCKSIKFTTQTSSLDAQIPGTEELTLGDSVGIMDEDTLSINELIDKCEEVIIKDVPLSKVIKDIISGVSFTGACKKYKLNSNKVKKALFDMGIVEILGGQLSPETIDKIMAN